MQKTLLGYNDQGNSKNNNEIGDANNLNIDYFINVQNINMGFDFSNSFFRSNNIEFNLGKLKISKTNKLIYLYIIKG